MICHECFGRGYHVLAEPLPTVVVECDACAGRGVVHCCEGHQPDAAELARLADDGNSHTPEDP